jgi:glycosyltransferase involved in cell wall biosynthesis
VRGVDVVFSDGEHLGIPMALAMRALRITTPHLVIGHHLDTRAKRLVFRWTKPELRMDRILVHSPNQLVAAHPDLAALEPRLRVVPYGIDTDFWCPQPVPEHEGLVVSAGREHRDYECLIQACPETAKLFIADHSPHSPEARRREPGMWPENVERRALGRLDLRRKYAQASMVVVPVIDTPFPFGITTILEGMSMGKAVVVSDTEGLHGVIEDGRTGAVVPPGDVVALRAAIEDLLADPAKRRRLGEQARHAAIERFGLDVYVGELARHLEELGGHGWDGEEQ